MTQNNSLIQMSKFSSTTKGTSHFRVLVLATIFCISICFPANITTVDFTHNAILSNVVLWNNIFGISMNTQKIYEFMNQTIFQQYLMNSNFKGNWANNWALSLKTPKGFRYECQALQNATNATIDCLVDSSINTTVYDVLGQYVWNTVNQPYWCISYDLQGVDLTNQAQGSAYFDWLFQVYTSTYYVQYCDEIMDYGDKAVQMGYKTGTYTAQDFLADIDAALSITNYIWHSGPGITDDADPSWMAAIQDFSMNSQGGHYTIRAIIFPNIADLTIPNLLSDTYTTTYLENRFYVNSTFSFTSFRQYLVGFNDIKLSAGMGIDGITNSFAAAIWAIDFALQFSLYQPFEMDFNNDIQVGNYQTLFGPGPQFKPYGLYYGLLFLSLIRDGTPRIILPSQVVGISQNIKAWGLSTSTLYKFVLLNKDTNASLNGNVYVKTYLIAPATCIYLSAPSLAQTQNITLGGYKFLSNNSVPQGVYTTKVIDFDPATSSYPIPIKYAQAVYCYVTDSTNVFPTGKGSFQFRTTLTLTVILSVIMVILIH